MMKRILNKINIYYNIENNLNDILNGAYVILKNDEGGVYNELKRHKHYTRISVYLPNFMNAF